ncbi:MAG: metal-dependent transcriptional regulator [Methanobacteriota archaeon]
MKNKTIEEYVEIIHQIEEKEGQACTNSLAAAMGVKPPSVTEVLQKLQNEGYIHYIPYAGATLTVRGRELAEKLRKKHRAIADFLTVIGISPVIAEIDACQVEHHVNEETVRRLELLLYSIQENPEISSWFERFSRS